MNRLILIILLFASCTHEMDHIKAKVQSLNQTDSSTHKANMEMLRIRKTLRMFENDSAMQYLQNVNSMKFINLQNKSDSKTDSLINEISTRQTLIEHLVTNPVDTIHDTIIITIIHIDSIPVYDTIQIYQDRKGMFHKLKEKPKHKSK